MKRHAPPPDREYAERAVDVVGEIVEQSVADPPAEHAANGRKKYHVGDILTPPLGTVPGGSTLQHPPTETDTDDVGYPIPVDGYGPQFERYRIDGWERDHGAHFSPQLS